MLLIGVFHIHALYASIEWADGELVQQARWQIKVLAPHVALYFALAGMTSHSLGRKSGWLVLQRSLMLLLLALLSHAFGVLISLALWQPWHSVPALLAAIARPVAEGTGYATFVAWFFVVLAIVRLFAFALARGWAWSIAVLAGAAALVGAARALGAHDNIYEWRNWPAALVLFWLGTHIAASWRVPHAAGALCTAAGLALPLLNHPALLHEGWCLACDPAFVAQPMVGAYGVMPLFFLQEAMSVVGLLWLAQLASAIALGRLLAWVGRHSLQLLLLHGWVILSFYGLIHLLPRSGGVWLFPALLVLNTLMHLGLYRLLRVPIDRFVALCSSLSRRVVSLARRPMIPQP